MWSKHRHHSRLIAFENLESLCDCFKRKRILIVFNLLLKSNLRTLNDSLRDLQLLGELDNAQANHGGFTPCQVEHHVHTKFATPILHDIGNFKNRDIISTHT